MKTFEQYFPVVLFIMLIKVVLAFESVDVSLPKFFAQLHNYLYCLVCSIYVIHYLNWQQSYYHYGVKRYSLSATVAVIQLLLKYTRRFSNLVNEIS